MLKLPAVTMVALSWSHIYICPAQAVQGFKSAIFSPGLIDWIHKTLYISTAAIDPQPLFDLNNISCNVSDKASVIRKFIIDLKAELL